MGLGSFLYFKNRTTQVSSDITCPKNLNHYNLPPSTPPHKSMVRPPLPQGFDQPSLDARQWPMAPSITPPHGSRANYTQSTIFTPTPGSYSTNFNSYSDLAPPAQSPLPPYTPSEAFALSTHSQSNYPTSFYPPPETNPISHQQFLSHLLQQAPLPQGFSPYPPTGRLPFTPHHSQSSSSSSMQYAPFPGAHPGYLQPHPGHTSSTASSQSFAAIWAAHDQRGVRSFVDPNTARPRPEDALSASSSSRQTDPSTSSYASSSQQGPPSTEASGSAGTGGPCKKY
jgi:hypothetical protein